MWSGYRDGAMNSYDYGGRNPKYSALPREDPLRDDGNRSLHLLHIDGLYVWAQSPVGGPVPCHVSYPSIPPPGGTLGETTMATTGYRLSDNIVNY